MTPIFGSLEQWKPGSSASLDAHISRKIASHTAIYIKSLRYFLKAESVQISKTLTFRLRSDRGLALAESLLFEGSSNFQSSSSGTDVEVVFGNGPEISHRAADSLQSSGQKREPSL